ncbi:helix-turn-helix domain-containing protein [Actinoplanes friuliensis]|uniref:Putative transcriptional regulator n=1 Tax=Actinoplanes friuliensis DSM 7358 TaxID=1246995 RepID=U5VU87_9ACTN|nr:helix-turn-helix transcriptional regulator [Actinoplanes friuliensis]AGZ40439.1 putative transcriptional regulator [Actinoplanes friuliensis DSM 7358]
MTEPVGPALARALLSKELRALRGDAPAADVAGAMHWSLAKLNRIENNKVTIQALEVEALAKHYGVTDAEALERLVGLALISRQRMWWRDRHFPDELTNFIAFENDASHLYAYQATFVPPLLQTRAYAEALTSSVLQKPVDDPTVAGLVDARMKRRETLMARLASGHPPSVSQAIDESVLLRPIGGAAVMDAQLDHLVEMAGRETVELTVLPLRLGVHPGLSGAFELLTFTEDRDLDVVFIETPGTDFLLTDTENTAPFRRVMDELLTMGESLDETVRKVRKTRRP